ncbi:aldehyde dehydrogenase family 3 member B1-like [Spea bombifrons]|uniref:aldehyde dehydrogenase family 3 member B1-like n=1 Tax=Spea bombifrons TaxID=233779 RepID=UPI00234A6B13|nr:aldehyde dehydrogenase family 3 member B1-like [Spea bombifrons]
MDHTQASPSPARWFRVFKRTVSTENPVRKTSTSSLCEEVLKKSQDAFASEKTKHYSFRLLQLEAILRMLESHEEEFVAALEKDMRRPRFETVLSEITAVKNEALYAINNLQKWMEPEHVHKNMTSLLDSCFVQKEPVGVVLIVGGWSFPIQLCLIPMIGAVAAGNCVILKPSEITTHTTDLLHKLIPLYVDACCYHVLNSEHGELLEILENKYDYMFYAGDRNTGRQVMQAAAKHITPVSLVLGGKNPCYVDKSCDLTMAARRIAWARFVNAGQNSLAPEYILCHSDLKDALIRELCCCVREFYGNDPRESPDYGRMASAEQYSRVKNLLCCGQVAFGGQTDDGERYIAPTVLTDVQENDIIMQQEILGPILPIFTVQTLEGAISFIKKKGRPLAVYAFSDNIQVISHIMSRTSSGSFCSNDSMIQSLYTSLPCGGIGNSGVGVYRGKYSFDTFSHSRACLLRNSTVECVTYLRYPPYVEKQLQLMKWACTLSRNNSWCNIL